MVRPSFATNTDFGSCKAIISRTFPELNRSMSDGITPSGLVGRGKGSDIRISCSCSSNYDAATIGVSWRLLIATPDELFQYPRRILFIIAGHGGGASRESIRRSRWIA